jgi:hypothetical protein
MSVAIENCLVAVRRNVRQGSTVSGGHQHSNFLGEVGILDLRARGSFVVVGQIRNAGYGTTSEDPLVG